MDGVRAELPSGVSPLMVALGFQPPLFHYQEEEADVPSFRAHLCLIVILAV